MSEIGIIIHFSRLVLGLQTNAHNFRHWNSRKSYTLIIEFSKISRYTFSKSGTGTFGFRLLPKIFDF